MKHGSLTHIVDYRTDSIPILFFIERPSKRLVWNVLANYQKGRNTLRLSHIERDLAKILMGLKKAIFVIEDTPENQSIIIAIETNTKYNVSIVPPKVYQLLKETRGVESTSSEDSDSPVSGVS